MHAPHSPRAQGLVLVLLLLALQLLNSMYGPLKEMKDVQAGRATL